MARVTGGSAFAKKLKDLANSFKQAKTVRVGFLEKAKYPDGTSVAMVAAIQNFGAPKQRIPPRPFFTNAVKDNSPGWAPGLAATLKRTMDIDKSLALLGQQIKGEIQQSIRDTNSPPLAAATVARRLAKLPKSKRTTAVRNRAAKPLIDTAHMINSVDAEVMDGLPTVTAKKVSP